MAKRPDWDYALHIKGVDLKSLPMSALAEYLKEFANLLGENAKPVLDGIVKGSVVVRAKQHGEHPAITRNRLQIMQTNGDSVAAKSYQKLQTMLARDQARADVVDRQMKVVVSFAQIEAANERAIESIVHDTGTIDGRVVSITGADDTVHIKLMNDQQQEYKITVRDLGLAKELASKFRGPIVRVHVHGTWKRDINGKWIGHSIYADSLEELEEDSLLDVMSRLKAHPGGWLAIEDPTAEWLEIRGQNDLHS
jgi:hypothetical protein